MVKHIIILSGLLISIEFKLGGRMCEDFDWDELSVWKLSELLFELIESGWWF